MSLLTYCSEKMIVCFLVCCLIQIDVPASAAPNGHVLYARDGETASQTDAVLNDLSTGTSAALNQTGSMMNTAASDLTQLVKQTGSTAMDFGSEATKSMEEVLKAGGRASLAVGNLCSQLFNGLSATMATGSSFMASGVNTVDGYLNRVPVVGVVSGGLNRFIGELSTTFNDISSNARQSRQKMFQTLREQLNGISGTATSAATSAASVATTSADGSAANTETAAA